MLHEIRQMVILDRKKLIFNLTILLSWLEKTAELNDRKKVKKSLVKCTHKHYPEINEYKMALWIYTRTDITIIIIFKQNI